MKIRPFNISNKMQEQRNLQAEEETYSNPRSRSFFGFNPIEFSDDVAIALSYYMDNALGSIISILSNVKVSEKKKEKFQDELIQILQNSVNLNSDKFELYILRNIFDISVNIDLTSTIDTPKNDKAADEDVLNGIDNDDSFDDRELDSQLMELYAQIQECQAERVQLITSIKTNKAQLNEANEIVNRLPKINQIIDLVEKIPPSEIEGVAQKIKELLDRVNDLASHEQNEKRTFQQDKESFDFD